MLPIVLALAVLSGSQEASRGDRLVKVELLADRAAIRAGDHFTIAAKLSVDAGWHIYWENPGDSGMPTRLTVKGPPGFTIGDARYPAPRREEAEGDIVTFVHDGDVVFLADVEAPKDLAKGSKAAFELEAHWLVCQETCYPGGGKAHLELPASETTAPANEKLFAAARARMPKPWDELEGAKLAWSGSGKSLALAIEVPKATSLELFPLVSRTTKVAGVAIAATSSSARLTADLAYEEIAPAEPPRLQGVLVVKTAQGESAYRIDSIFSKSAK